MAAQAVQGCFGCIYSVRILHNAIVGVSSLLLVIDKLRRFLWNFGLWMVKVPQLHLKSEMAIMVRIRHRLQPSTTTVEEGTLLQRSLSGLHLDKAMLPLLPSQCNLIRRKEAKLEGEAGADLKVPVKGFQR